MSKIQNIIFDLDGTIIDPKIGITKSIQYAMEKLGYESLSADELLWCIGPPLQDSFSILLNNSNREFINKAVTAYREYYLDKGIYEHSVYDGIEKLLIKLNEMSRNVFIATSKPWIMAEKIINYHKFEKYFMGIYGPELDGTRSNKVELISYLLKTEKISNKNSIMIGDRKHDIIGGKNNNMKTCGVTYGYGSTEELRDINPDYIIDDPAELPEKI